MRDAQGLPSVSVIIPTYNGRHRLDEVLEPLLADRAADEVVVVVDGSEDDSFEHLQGLATHHEKLRPLLQPNAGQALARQAGVEAARGEVVLLIDDDVVAEPGLVAGHARLHRDRDDLVVVGYMPPDQASGTASEGFTVELYAAEYEGRCGAYEADQASVLLHLWAGNVSLRREHALEVGLARPEFPWRYHEDREFGLRLAEAGLSGCFSRELRATHRHRRDLAGFRRDARNQGAGLVQVLRLHPGGIEPLRADHFTRSAPGPVAALIALTRRPRAARWTLLLLSVLVRITGAVGQRPAQLAAARVVRRIEQQQGAIMASAGVRAPTAAA